MIKPGRSLLLACLLLPACAGEVSEAGMVLGPSPMGDFAGAIESVEARKFATVVRQRYDFSCGSAALATLLTFHYGQPAKEETTFRGMWAEGDREQIRKLGFSLLDMKRFLEQRGMPANGFKVTLPEVEKAGVPGIALVTLQGYRHFVVVKGVRNGEVLVGDPSLGLQVVPADKFVESWNGVYFVIDRPAQEGLQRFNAASHWASYNRAPMGSRFSDPVSQQALALTAPFYRDF